MGSLKSALEMAAYRWIIILLIGCSIVLPIQGWGNKEKCQLRLYAVQEFMVSNDVINDNTPARHQRRTDKSLSTVGNCCWTLYNRKYFRGRKTIVAGNAPNKGLIYLLYTYIMSFILVTHCLLTENNEIQTHQFDYPKK